MENIQHGIHRKRVLQPCPGPGDKGCSERNGQRVRFDTPGSSIACKVCGTEAPIAYEGAAYPPLLSEGEEVILELTPYQKKHGSDSGHGFSLEPYDGKSLTVLEEGPADDGSVHVLLPFPATGKKRNNKDGTWDKKKVYTIHVPYGLLLKKNPRVAKVVKAEEATAVAA